MDNSFTLPLRPLGKKRDHKDTLPIEISQINSQWGSFRDVSEASLREEIAATKNRDSLSLEEEGKINEEKKEEAKENASQDVDTTEHMEQLYKRRAEILQFAL